MFKFDTPDPVTLVEVILDGRPEQLPGEMNVAASLLAAGHIISRMSPTSKKACSPHCMMGVCCECMMEINGVHRQACMTRIEPGMVINRHLDKGEDK